MRPLTTIKRTCVGTLAIYDADNELIATSEKKKCGRYLICIYGGQLHGKVAYAQDFADLNVKSVEILRLRDQLKGDC